jgi:YfiH family protein
MPETPTTATARVPASAIVRSAMLDQLTGVAHAFFGRGGGVSTGLYASLNAGPGSDDDPAAVAENRARIAASMGVKPDRLLSAHQIHSADAMVVDAPFAGERPRVDGLVTRAPTLALSVLSADCAPILLADPIARVVGAAHAGWKGAVGGVIEATIRRMTGLGAAPGRIVAAIGPCIAQASYEVGPEFHAAILSSDPDADRLFAPGAGDRLLFDLKGFCARRLRAAGVSAVDVLPHDTCALADDFFSNRRRNHAGEPDYGRNLSAIRLTGG